MRLLISIAALVMCAPVWSGTSDTAPEKSAPPASTPARLVRPADPKNYYPAESVRRGEQGISGVQSCVDASGKLLRDPVIIATSGLPAIDAAAMEVAKNAEYAAAIENGAPLTESCVQFKVQFKADADTKRREGPRSPIVQACVGPAGELLREPTIIESSGFPDVDAAAVKIAKATKYKAGKESDTPLPESCIKFKIKFEMAVP